MQAHECKISFCMHAHQTRNQHLHAGIGIQPALSSQAAGSSPQCLVAGVDVPEGAAGHGQGLVWVRLANRPELTTTWHEVRWAPQG